jgi:hypothetical protein
MRLEETGLKQAGNISWKRICFSRSGLTISKNTHIVSINSGLYEILDKKK